MSSKREFAHGDGTIAVRAEAVGGDHWRVRVGDRSHEFRVAALGDGGIRLVPVGGDAGPACVAYAVTKGKTTMVRVGGRTFTLHAPAARGGGSAGGADGSVRAPMTGTVLKVACKPGDVVAADQTLVVLTAMKMEHKLVAGIAGTVVSVAAVEGGAVEQGVVLVHVEASRQEGPAGGAA